MHQPSPSITLQVKRVSDGRITTKQPPTIDLGYVLLVLHFALGGLDWVIVIVETVDPWLLLAKVSCEDEVLVVAECDVLEVLELTEIEPAYRLAQ